MAFRFSAENLKLWKVSNNVRLAHSDFPYKQILPSEIAGSQHPRFLDLKVIQSFGRKSECLSKLEIGRAGVTA